MEVMDAHEKYLEIMRKKTPEERLKIVFELNEMVREAARTDIRFQNPNISGQEIEKQLRKRIKLYELLNKHGASLCPKKNRQNP